MTTLASVTALFTDAATGALNCADLAIDLRESYGCYMAVITEALIWAEVEEISKRMRRVGLSSRMHGGAVGATMTFEDGSKAQGFSWVFDDNRESGHWAVAA